MKFLPLALAAALLALAVPAAASETEIPPCVVIIYTVDPPMVDVRTGRCIPFIVDTLHHLLCPWVEPIC